MRIKGILKHKGSMFGVIGVVLGQVGGIMRHIWESRCEFGRIRAYGGVLRHIRAYWNTRHMKKDK